MFSFNRLEMFYDSFNVTGSCERINVSDNNYGESDLYCDHIILETAVFKLRYSGKLLKVSEKIPSKIRHINSWLRHL